MRLFDRSLAALLAVLFALPPGFAWAEKPGERRARDIVESIPHDRYDIAALAPLLRPGVEDAFRFVRDEIALDAYTGVLRGAELTLASAAGNAFDRALLLAALLDAKGVRFRFATGRLDDQRAAQLFDRMFERKREVAAAAPGMHLPGGEPSSLYGVVRARAARDLEAVREALGETWSPAPVDTRTAALADLRDHAWVEAAIGEKWVPLDTAFGDAEPGVAHATATWTGEEFPVSLHQRVVLRVFEETLRGGRLESTKRLEYAAPAVDLLDLPLVLVHVRPADLAGALGSAIVGPDAWTPGLWVGGSFYAGQPLSFSDATGATERGRPPRGGLGGALGRGGALSSGSDFVAEWLEVETTLPGGAAHVARRALVDRAGAGWRAAATKEPSKLRLLARVGEDLVAPRQMHVVWLTASAHDLQAYGDAVLALHAEAARPPESRKEDGYAERLWPLAVQAAGLSILADNVLLPSLHDDARWLFYAARPRVSLVSIGPAPGEAATYLVDLLDRDVRGVAWSEAEEPAVARRHAWLGLLEGALEHEACAHLYPRGGSAPKVASASGRLDEGGGAVARPAAVPDPDAHARMLAAAAEGRTVVVPQAATKGGMPAWWEIAPGGATRAVLGEGWGGGGTTIPGGAIPASPPVNEPTINNPPWRERHWGPDVDYGPGRGPPPPGANTPRPPPRPPPRGTVPFPNWPKPRNPMPPAGPRIPPPPWQNGPMQRPVSFPPGSQPVPGASPAPVRKKPRNGGGNEYLMVITAISLEIVFNVLLMYGPQLMRAASEYVADRVTDYLNAATEARRPR